MKFNSFQVDRFLTLLEKYGIEGDFGSDAHMSQMFSELLIIMLQDLNEEQVKELWELV